MSSKYLTATLYQDTGAGRELTIQKSNTAMISSTNIIVSFKTEQLPKAS